jgi:large subunit ribosomal protein L21
MYAVIETGNQQFKVEKGQELSVPLLEKGDLNKGSDIVFDKVLLLNDNDDVQIGKPVLSNVNVKAKLVNNYKDKKVKVFKFKRRKRYKVDRGHRQQYSRIKIEDIVVK